MKKSILFAVLTALHMVIYAQIPNPGFENWVSHGAFQEPQGWASYNNLYPGVVVCLPSTDHTEGIYSLMLRSVYDSVTSTVVPGWIYSGTYDSVNSLILTGFPYGQRPLRFKGDYKYTRMGSDVGGVVARLTKWDPVNQQPIQVGQAYKAMNTAMSTWFTFSVNFTYFTADEPDTCSIILNCSNFGTAVAGTTLLIDNLQLEGPFAIDETEAPEIVSIFPNPASAVVNLTFDEGVYGDVEVELLDLTMKQVCREKRLSPPAGETMQLGLPDIAEGLYTLMVRTNKGPGIRKLQVVR